MKKLFLSIAALLCFCQLFASHLEGAEIRYEFTGSGYLIYLTTYSSCGGIAAPSTETINITGPSSYTAAVTAVMTSRDTLNPYCSSVVTRCQSVTSTIPGYILTRYQVAVTLPTTLGIYTFSYTGSARNSSNNIGSGNLYAESILNNTWGINSSVWVPNTSSLYLAAGASTATAIPLNGTDAQGDSIVYAFSNPLSAASTGIAYNAGYSMASPLGGSGICSLAGQKLYLKGTIAGNFFIVIKMMDYRNGNLVGTSYRDFMVYVLPGTGGYSIPAPTSTTPLWSTTCPGAANSVTLSFTDPVSTDSVYVDVTTPTISGFTFTVTPSPGIGTGSSTVTWTSPGSLNPATLTHFYFNITARDNACPGKANAKFAHVVITGPCASDSVWPGDANGDKTVNIYDPLAVAIASGKTGATRPGASSSWVAQACTNWANSFLSGVNMKHADCDGNGTVTSADLSAITTNWSMTHPKPGLGNNQNKVTGLPNLGFDHTGITFTPGATVTVPLKLGDASAIMNNIYGLCGKIIIDGITLANPYTLGYTGSWLGTSGTTLNFIKRTNNNISDWAYARTTQSNTSGQGTLATVTFTIPSNVAAGSKIILRITNQKIIDKDGNDVGGFNIIDDTVTVQNAASAINQANNIIQYAAVVPNPSSDNAELHIAVYEKSVLYIKVTDLMGKTIWQSQQAVDAGYKTLALPSAQLSRGAYIIHIENEKHQAVYNLKWMKQ